MCFICSNIFSEDYFLSHVAALLSLEAVVKGFPEKELHFILLLALMIKSQSSKCVDHLR